MQKYGKCQIRLITFTGQCMENHQMSRTRNRKKFGYALYYPGKQSLQSRQKNLHQSAKNAGASDVLFKPVTL